MPNPRDFLGRGDFRQLYAARLASQFADGVFEASLINFVIFNPNDAPDARAIAGSLAAVLLPFTVIGPFAGCLLDRVSRQRVLLTGALVRSVLCLIVAALMSAGHRGPDLYIVAIAILSVSRFVLAALSAAMPLTLTDDRAPTAATLVSAGSLSTTSGTVISLAGAGVGTLIRTAIGDSNNALAVVAMSAATAYLCAAGIAGRCQRSALGPIDPPPMSEALSALRKSVADVIDGARHLWAARQARNTLLAVSAHRLAYGLTFVAGILLYRSYFGKTESSGNISGLGVLVAAVGVGTLIAAIITPRATRRWGRHHWVSANLLLAGIVELAFGLPFQQSLFVMAGLFLGFVAQSIKLSCDSLVQEQIPDIYRGRAFSTYDLAVNSCYVAAAGIAALLLPSNGHSPTALLLISGIYFCTAVVFSHSRH